MSRNLAAAEEPIKAIMEAPFPIEKTPMRSFPDECNVYRRVVHGFEGVARPLDAVLRKEVEREWHAPSENELEAFEKLKMSFVNPPVLKVTKRGCPFMVDSDASKYALGMVLIKEQEVSWEVSSEK